MKTVKVIYPKGSFGSEDEVVNTLAIPSLGDVYEDLETIFRYMNHVDGSEIESQLMSFKCRSMSVGDIVEYNDGESYICENIGFKPLEKEIKE